MRRHLVLAAALAGLLVVSGCGSDSGTKRTVTAVVTVSSSAAAPASSGASVSASVSASPKPSASPTPTSTKPAPFAKVDPLKVDCAAILNAADVKKTLNTDIPNDRLKVNVAEVNTDIGQTGRIRCFYGVSGDKKSGTIIVALTQYKSAAAAQKQVDVTVQTEQDNGAKIIPVTVNGYPATVALRDGGLLVMAYDTWTMGIATSSAVKPAALEAGLPKLAEAALTRITKG